MKLNSNKPKMELDWSRNQPQKVRKIEQGEAHEKKTLVKITLLT
jgi:hypothetical protein